MYLEAGFSGAGSMSKDLDDEPHPVQDRPVPGSLQVALLHPAQHAIHKNPAAATLGFHNPINFHGFQYYTAGRPRHACTCLVDIQPLDAPE